jgi:hypothetical protein
VDGFYVEVFCSPECQNLPIIRCCTISDIDDYLSLIDISAIYSLLKN